MNPNTVQNDITYGTTESNVTNKNEQRRNQTCKRFHILKKRQSCTGKSGVSAELSRGGN